MYLAAAIDAVYEAFSDVEKPRSVPGCSSFMSVEECDVLTGTSLRELLSYQLSPYAMVAMVQMGSEADYPYFLPRILELTIADDDYWLAAIEVTAKKMRMAGSHEWSEKRRTAIAGLWRAVVRELATSRFAERPGLTARDISSWLAAATVIPIPVSPLTASLEDFPDIVQTLCHLNARTISQGRLDNDFLPEPSQGQTEIANWLLRSVGNAQV